MHRVAFVIAAWCIAHRTGMQSQLQHGAFFRVCYSVR